jgi:hypothetical protein
MNESEAKQYNKETKTAQTQPMKKNIKSPIRNIIDTADTPTV